MPDRTIKQVCECKNCGNEAEMVITCSLQPEAQQSDKGKKTSPEAKPKVKGRGVCSHCGNEADMWIDL